MRSKPRKPKPPLERDIQRSVVQYLRACGWTVWITSQGYRKDPGGTRMSPGIPDLYAVHEYHGAAWFEIKRGNLGRLSVAQEEFAMYHDAGDHGLRKPSVYVIRSLDGIRALGKNEGWSREVTS